VEAESVDDSTGIEGGPKAWQRLTRATWWSRQGKGPGAQRRYFVFGVYRIYARARSCKPVKRAVRRDDIPIAMKSKKKKTRSRALEQGVGQTGGRTGTDGSLCAVVTRSEAQMIQYVHAKMISRSTIVSSTTL